MERALKKAVNTWLKAEAGADPDRAELALRRVFLRLPPVTPPAGFSAAVLARLGIAPQALFAPLRLAPQWKAVLAVSFALVAILGGAMPRLLGTLWIEVGPGRAVDLLAGALVSLTARLADGAAVWTALTGVARIVSESLYSPQMMTVVAAAALLSAIALRLLHGLLISERNPRYAQSG